MKQYPVKFYVELLRLHLTQNGWAWTFFFCLNHMAGRFLPFAQGQMTALEKKHGLPGRNSKAENKLKWNLFSWEEHGEEWTAHPAWKDSLVEHVMSKYLEKGKDILEIGPGGGRWTEFLQRIANRLTVVDISETCIELCRKRFEGYGNMDFYVNDGCSLGFAGDGIFDYVWSFDVFVHIQPEDIEKYLAEFERVLKPGGTAVIHHAGQGSGFGGWRSEMTAPMFISLLEKNRLELVIQFDQWGDDPGFNVKHFRDMITVFRKK